MCDVLLVRTVVDGSHDEVRLLPVRTRFLRVLAPSESPRDILRRVAVPLVLVRRRRVSTTRPHKVFPRDSHLIRTSLGGPNKSYNKKKLKWEARIIFHFNTGINKGITRTFMNT